MRRGFFLNARLARPFGLCTSAPLREASFPIKPKEMARWIPSANRLHERVPGLRFVSGSFFAAFLFSTTWPALFSGLFPVCFLARFFVFNNFGSFVSALFPVCFLTISLCSQQLPRFVFQKKEFFFLFWPCKTPLQCHFLRISPPYCSLSMASSRSRLSCLCSSVRLLTLRSLR